MSMKPGITIDSATTRDRDDAIWVAPRPSDSWRVVITIADVAGTVPRGSKFDVGKDGHPGAFERLETRYYAGGSRPMLPRRLSEDSCSLHPGQKRHGMTVEISLDKHLRPMLEEIVFEPFVSLGAVSYEEVPQIIGDEDHQWHNQIVMAASLASALLDKRQQQGALQIYDLNRGWVSNEEGIVVRLSRDESTIGYVIVQEMMILCNQVLAEHCASREIPILFRNHTAKAHAPTRQSIAAELQMALHRPIPVHAFDTLRQRLNLLLDKAEYGSTLGGHYGLSLPAYLHGSSPIRRYADLVNQRQIRASVRGEQLPYTREELDMLAAHINGTLLARKEAKSEALRERAHRQTERQLTTGEHLMTLGVKEFDRAIKVAMQTHPDAPPESLATSYPKRLASGRVGLTGQAYILLQSGAGYEALKRATIERLKGCPSDAASIMATGYLHGLRSAKFEETASGPPHMPVFKAVARTFREGELIEGNIAEGASRKQARQLALVELLAVLAGLQSAPQALRLQPIQHAEHHICVTEIDADEEETPPPPDPAVSNPVGALHEHCQKLALAAPSYTIKPVGGPSHAPIFEAVCTAMERSANARANSKKDAKRAAATALLQALQVSA